MDLAAPQPELTVWTATVRGKTCVAEAVQHVSKQGRKPGAVQPVTTELSVGSKGGVGVVIHLSETREKRINISFIEQRQQTKTPKINHDDNKTLTQILFSATTISQNSAD
jgi:Spy/CpxP family protein refolding chaperone